MRQKPEDALLLDVISTCKTFGLRVAHFRPALTKSGRWITPVQGDGKGYPDLTIVGRGGVMWRELKSDDNSPTAEQRAWIADLRAAGANVGVWKPRDWRSRLIIAELEELRRPRAVAA